MISKELLSELDPIARKFGFYTAYELTEEEFVGFSRVGDIDQLKVMLMDCGYEDSRLFAAKYHPSTGEIHDLGMRKVDTHKKRWQYHVHAWDMESNVVVFSHYEMRPDFVPVGGESLTDMISRLRIHYRPDWGEEYIRGKYDDCVKELVNVCANL